MSDKGFWGKVKGAFVEEVPEQAHADRTPAQQAQAQGPAQRNTPVPVQRNTPLPPPPQEIDTAVRQKLESAVDSGMPAALRGLRETVATLAETIPDPDVAFKTAVKLAAKQGNDIPALLNDVDVCVGILDKKKGEFEAAGQKTMKSAVEERERRASELNAAVTEKRRQINALSLECEQLEAEERQVTADAVAERQRISAIAQGFNGAYESVKRNLTVLRQRLAATEGKA